MKKLVYYSFVLLPAILIIFTSSCEKETQEDQTGSTNKNLEHFVIGSSDFFNEFNIDLQRNIWCSSDSSQIVHSFNLDTSYMVDVTITEYRDVTPITTSSNYNNAISIDISSDQILSEVYVDYQLKTRNSTFDTNRTINKNSHLPSFSDTLWNVENRIKVPKLFSLGDTITWSNEFQSEDSECLIFKYIRRGQTAADGFEDIEINQTDILGADSKYLVLKYINAANQYKFGVFELRMNSDTTLIIRNVYTQK